jgi:hypothetical protein
MNVGKHVVPAYAYKFLPSLPAQTNVIMIPGSRPPFISPPQASSHMHHAPQVYNPHNLPPSILALFVPRQPLHYMPPIEKSTLPMYSGLSDFVDRFESKEEHTNVSSFTPSESRRQRKERIESEFKSKAESKIREELRKCKLTLIICSKYL